MALQIFGTASPLGSGSIVSRGLADSELLEQLRAYKRRVAGVYRAITAESLDEAVASGPALVSPKLDGELWYLVIDADSVALVSPIGHVIQGDVPVLAAALPLRASVAGRTVIAGELFATVASGRPRAGDVARAMGGGRAAAIDRLSFMAFDLIAGGDATAQVPLPDYAQRLDVLRRLLPESERLHPAPSEIAADLAAVTARWKQWVADGQAEGLILRAPSGIIFKAKPAITLDVVVVAFTERAGEPGAVRSLLLGLYHQDGSVRLVGGSSNAGDSDARRHLYTRLSALETASSYRHASGGGGLYRFVRPEIIAEVRVTDVQTENADGLPIRNMALIHGNDGWRIVAQCSAASLLHAVVLRLRDDKPGQPVDARFAQLGEAGFPVTEADASRGDSLPESTLLTRAVWTKEAKGVVAVRKYVAWKTNKETIATDFPAYVVHWTDYSPSRGIPLLREVRTASSESGLKAILDILVADNVKKGWVKVA